MPDPSHQPDHNLSEISHLFLSSVRDKTTGNAPRPQRTPPPKTPIAPAVSIDLTPEEFAQVFGGDEAESAKPQDRGPAPVPQVTAIIGGHLNGKQFDRVKEYARHMAAEGTRVGLIEIDASEFRVMCFDRDTSADGPEATIECSFDPRRMNEVLEEMSWDVQRWLLILPTPRVPEARALLRDAPRWTLLSTCDHDGVISCYRTLKGLTDLWPSGPAGDKPQLSLALLDAQDDEQSERVAAKLSSVCQQFLNWPLAIEPAVRPTQRVGEHLVMCCRPNRDKAQLASAPQWEIVADFIRRSREAVVAEQMPVESMTDESMAAESTDAQPEMVAHSSEPEEIRPQSAKRFVADVVVPSPQSAPESAQVETPRVVTMQYVDSNAGTLFPMSATEKSDTTDVIDLPSPENGEGGIVDAILKHCASELVECPVTPPMCPRAKLAVGRDHRIVMLAVSREGLSDLNTIGLAYKWLQENQNLIGMAVPQLSIDTHQPPHLSLLVNQADSTAHTLQPMLEGGHVTVKTYRKLRWGGKTGLLLEAA